MTDQPAAIVLAAGRGTRMKSHRPKVLHEVAGRPMILHLLDRLAEARIDKAVVVVAPGMTDVVDTIAAVDIKAVSAVQEQALGTAHAVLAARDALGGAHGDVMVLFGDTPLLTVETMRSMLDVRQGPGDPAVVVLGFTPDDPAQYGRLVRDKDGNLLSIVEYRDASEAERGIGLCNAGIMVIDGKVLFGLLDSIGNDNAKGEYYLTDIVAIARAEGRDCKVVVAADPLEVHGVNSRAELAVAEAAMQGRLRRRAMDAGATLIDPETVYLAADTALGTDVTVGPHVVFGGGVTVGDDVEIRAFSHIEGATIESGAVVGPFARLRPGAHIGEKVHIGNFVEIKAAEIEAGAKVNHLSYVGDARVGAGANVGAGTITCNYDGFEKFHTDIGAGAFIGSNTALVAPVKVGDGAVVGAGSVLSDDVDADALALTRADVSVRDGWAAEFRARRQAAKQAAKQPSKRKKTG